METIITTKASQEINQDIEKEIKNDQDKTWDDIGEHIRSDSESMQQAE